MEPKFKIGDRVQAYGHTGVAKVTVVAKSTFMETQYGIDWGKGLCMPYMESALIAAA